MSRRDLTPVVLGVLVSSLQAGCETNVNLSADNSGWSWSDDRPYSSVETRSFAVADSGTATIDTFVGAITVRQGPSGTVDVVATRRADREADLAILDVAMSLDADTVTLTGTNPAEARDVSVDFEVTGPVDMGVDAHTAVGPIVCDGRPSRWNVDVGVGSIELVVPEDANMTVDLVASVGSVDVSLPVQGSVSGGRVVGTIGTGADGAIVARCSVGGITLRAR